MKPLNPSIVCKDGFRISVQGSQYAYCQPRIDEGPYSHVECGFPSLKPSTSALREYAEDLYGKDEADCDFTDTVYGYVPVEIVLNELAQHGGVESGKMPE
jgi:hypothetical protein